MIISIILNVVLGLILWGAFTNLQDLEERFEIQNRYINKMFDENSSLIKEIRDAQLEYQGIKDQFYKDTGE